MGILDDFFIGLQGKFGEKKIARKLNVLDFWGYGGKCLKNLYIPREDGSTSEIDIVVSILISVLADKMKKK